jgi:inner membrane protein
MKAPTHTSFGILFILGIGLLLGITFNPALAGLAVLGALLPDIDTEKSAIGRLLGPIALYIERKLGHRQATHSLIALVLLGLGTAPLIYLKLFWWIALLCGYLSHLIIDTVNKSGVPLFYPSKVRAVMPKSEKWRITVGSKAEIILFTIISLLVFLLLPINRVGLFLSLHYIIKDTPSAVADYRSWADEYRVYANVSGTFNISQKPIVSQFEVLGIENKNSLGVYDARADKIYTVGTDQNANIYPKSIRCIKGEPISVLTKKVHLENELLGNLTNHIPQEGQTFIKGTIKTADKVILPNDPDTYETIKTGINEIELQYARQRDFENVQVSTIFTLSSDLYLRTILPKESKTDALSLKQTQPADSMGVVKYEFSRKTSEAPVVGEAKPNSLLRLPVPARQTGKPPSFNSSSTVKSAHLPRIQVVEMYIQNVRDLGEILIQEGQYIKEGELIACLKENDQKLKLQEQTIKRQIDLLTNKPIDSQALFKALEKVKAKKKEQQLKQEIFKATQQLYESAAISHTAFIKEEQKLAQAEIAIIEAEQGFDELKEKLEWEQKKRQYLLDQAILKLNAIQQEREQNKIYAAVNARVLLIRTHVIHNNNLTIAIKLLVNAPSPTLEDVPDSSKKPLSNPPPLKEERPKNDSFIKAMERKAQEKSLPVPKAFGTQAGVSFLQNTPYRKKTHTKLKEDGGNNALPKTITFNPSFSPVSKRFLRPKPFTTKYHHEPSFFT